MIKICSCVKFIKIDFLKMLQHIKAKATALWDIVCHTDIALRTQKK